MPSRNTKHFEHEASAQLCRQVVPSCPKHCNKFDPHLPVLNYALKPDVMCAVRGFLSLTTSREVVEVMECLVDLLDGGSGGSTTTGSGTTSSREATWHALWHTARHATGALVQLCDDWVANLLQLFLLMFVFVSLCSLKINSVRTMSCLWAKKN